MARNGPLIFRLEVREDAAEMRIDSSQIWLTSTRSYKERHEERESLRMWADPPGARQQVSGTEEVLVGTGNARSSSARGAGVCESCAPEGSGGDKRLILLKSLIEAMTGRRIRLLDVSEITDYDNAGAYASRIREKAPPAGRETGGAGWGIEHTREALAREEESTTVETQGVIKTRDGKEIRFSITLAMERRFESRSRTDFRTGDARKTDPIVINFDGSAAQLTDTKFAFDLNADGAPENVSFTRTGKGMLVLDRNGDGKPTDGAELFGPTTGNGFDELRAYDVDANGWLDENDPLFGALSAWTKDEDGNDLLTPLTEKGVAAINLSPVTSDFDLRDGENRLLGQVRKTGIYVDGEGNVKTIQQVDLTV